MAGLQFYSKHLTIDGLVKTYCIANPLKPASKSRGPNPCECFVLFTMILSMVLWLISTGRVMLLGFALHLRTISDVLVFVMGIGLGLVVDGNHAPPRLATERSMPDLISEKE